MCACVYVSTCKWALVSLVIFLRAEPLSGHPMIMDTLDCWQWEWTSSILAACVRYLCLCLCTYWCFFPHAWHESICTWYVKRCLPLSVSSLGLKCLGNQVWTLVRAKKRRNWRPTWPPWVHSNTTHSYACVHTSTRHTDQKTHVEWGSYTQKSANPKQKTVMYTYIHNIVIWQATEVLCCFSLQGTSAHSIQHVASTRRDCTSSV